MEKKLKSIYKRIRERCNNKNHVHYKYYWWKWITCSWNSFKEFYIDMASTFFVGASIDRINNSLWYSRENCRWVEFKFQSLNKTNTITYNWICATHMSLMLWWAKSLISKRIKRNWDIHKAFNTPVKK